MSPGTKSCLCDPSIQPDLRYTQTLSLFVTLLDMHLFPQLQEVAYINSGRFNQLWFFCMRTGWCICLSLCLNYSLLILFSLLSVSLSEWWRTRKGGRSTWCFLPVRASVPPAVRRGGRSHWRATDGGLTTSFTTTRACSRTGNWYGNFDI